jgi:hypothetical protein
MIGIGLLSPGLVLAARGGANGDCRVRWAMKQGKGDGLYAVVVKP